MMKTFYLNSDTIKTISLDIIDEANILAGKRRDLNIDKSNTALIVLDMQDYFINYNSNAYIPSSASIIGNVNELIAAFSQNNLPVIYTRHINNRLATDIMSKWWKRHIFSDDAYSAINNQIIRTEKPIVIEKKHYDAFHETKLEATLKDLGVKNIVLTGVMTNLCCESTARSAFIKGYPTIFPVDATAAYNYEYHRAACINLSFGFSILRMTEDILTALDNEAN